MLWQLCWLVDTYLIDGTHMKVRLYDSVKPKHLVANHTMPLTYPRHHSKHHSMVSDLRQQYSPTTCKLKIKALTCKLLVRKSAVALCKPVHHAQDCNDNPSEVPKVGAGTCNAASVSVVTHHASLHLHACLSVMPA